MDYLRENTSPSVEPITLAEAKNYAKVDTDADDALIEDMIVAARQSIEKEASIAMIEREYLYYANHIPEYGLLLPVGPPQSIEHFRYIDKDDNMQSLDESMFRLQKSDRVGHLFLTSKYNQPSDIDESNNNPWRITFSAGYAETQDDVPDMLKIAVKMLVLHWYEYRGVAIGKNMSHIPEAIQRIIAQHRLLTIG